MARPSLDDYFLAMLPLVASRGTCPRRQVACILVDEKGRLVATGYNGNAPGMAHCIDKPCPGAESIGGLRESCQAVHAEASALLQARASRREPCTAYCSLTPCFSCAKLLISAGITRVVAMDTYKYDALGLQLLHEAGVELKRLKNG
jgi:dCMP deaminase